MSRGSRSLQPARNRSIVRSWLTLPRLRRLSQTLFLGLFLVLLCKTGLRGSFPPGGVEFRLPSAVRAFLETDPLVAIANALATRALYRGLLWSLAILIPTLFLGRFFCGWICPLGTLNHLVSNIRSEKKSGLRRIASNRYKPWQGFKYYLLFALLVAALLGGALVGILDPIALTVRSLALSILPACNYALNALPGPGHGHSASAGRPARLQAGVFPPGFPAGSDLHRHPGAQSAHHPLLVPRGVPARCAVGSGFALVHSGTGKAPGPLRGLQPLPAPLPGRGRSHSRRAVAQSRMPSVHELRGRLPGKRDSIPLFSAGSQPGTMEGADLKRRKVLTGLVAGAVAIPLLRANTGLERRTARTADPASGGARRECEFLPAVSAAASA